MPISNQAGTSDYLNPSQHALPHRLSYGLHCRSVSVQPLAPQRRRHRTWSVNISMIPIDWEHLIQAANSFPQTCHLHLLRYVSYTESGLLAGGIWGVTREDGQPPVEGDTIQPLITGLYHPPLYIPKLPWAEVGILKDAAWELHVSQVYMSLILCLSIISFYIL